MPLRLSFSMAAAYRALRVADPRIGDLIDEFGPYKPRPTGDPYGSLVRNIMYQQLAGAAAKTIMDRMLAIYSEDRRIPTPTEILKTPNHRFRKAGVSHQKTGYLKDLARHVATGELDLNLIGTLDDNDVIKHLTAIHGVGEWTAHIFLMFELGRPNILPTGDLGIRKGMQKTYHLRDLPTQKHAKKIGSVWSPYASVASWYMWRVADTLAPN